MDLLTLAKEFGFPLAILVLAVVVLWRQWRLESKLRDQEKSEQIKRLTKREDELGEIYRKLARPSLEKLTELANKKKTYLPKLKSRKGCKNAKK